MDRLQGRNPVIEALQRGRRPVRVIRIDDRARMDAKLERLLELARMRGARVLRVPRVELDRLSGGDVHNGVVAEAEPLPSYSVSALLDELIGRGEMPFLALVDELSYEHNLGAILRSALGSGVHGVVLPTRRSVGISAVVNRVSMGGAEAVPVVREGISASIKRCQKAGLKIVGADMGGRPVWDVDLTGPVALVLGGESKGLSPTLAKRCDEIVAIPLMNELESLNVSVTAALLFFERVRQMQAQQGR
ncbi:MAG: 23S rRNA (guanosine(2251)-2'-O)-methyltransferase RlmB [Alphaproteobacteria bacterium]|nr:23S rRNA (guanosine(2251)-2'-O)-methyltransferase RlmB [Alphaproteobacteria bacterium]